MVSTTIAVSCALLLRMYLNTYFIVKAAAAGRQKARKVMTKKVKRGDKEFQELVDEMMADLVLQDMDAAAEAARRKAEQEHEVS